MRNTHPPTPHPDDEIRERQRVLGKLTRSHCTRPPPKNTLNSLIPIVQTKLLN